jgi:hypothetical protein
MTGTDRERCGARRPGWDHGPAVGSHRIPCILPAGHDGGHRDGLGQTWAPPRPPVRMCVACEQTTDRPVFVCWIDSGSGPGWSLYACPDCAGRILDEQAAWRLVVDHGANCPTCLGDGRCGTAEMLLEVHRAARVDAR